MRRHLARLLAVLAALAATPALPAGRAQAADQWNPPTSSSR